MGFRGPRRGPSPTGRGPVELIALGAGFLTCLAGCLELPPQATSPTGGQSGALGGVHATPSPGEFRRPVVDAVTADPDVVATDATQPVVLHVAAHSPDALPLQTYWQAEGGTLVASLGDTARWRPPARPGVVRVQVTVQDTRGFQALGFVNLTVRPPGAPSSPGAGGSSGGAGASGPPSPVSTPIPPTSAAVPSPPPLPLDPLPAYPPGLHLLARSDPGLFLSRLKTFGGALYALGSGDRVVRIQPSGVTTLPGSQLPSGGLYSDYAVDRDGTVLAFATLPLRGRRFVRVRGGVAEERALKAAGAGADHLGDALGMDEGGGLLAALNGSAGANGLYRFVGEGEGTLVLTSQALQVVAAPLRVDARGGASFLLNDDGVLYRSGASPGEGAAVGDGIRDFALGPDGAPVAAVLQGQRQVIAALDGATRRVLVGGGADLKELAEGLDPDLARLPDGPLSLAGAGHDLAFLSIREARTVWIAGQLL